MEAQVRPLQQTQSLSRRQAVVAMAVLWIAIHTVWLFGPLIAPDHDFPLFTRFVTGGSLLIGLVGLAGLWNGHRWGWWTFLVACVVNVFLAVPEVFGLPGILRVISIVAVVVVTTCLILLFRPGVRPAKG